jgi:signal transduction histidine kinase
MTPRPTSALTARLMRMNLLVSGTALVLAALAFFSYDLFSFRQNLIRNLNAEAQIIGDNTDSALTFDDPQSATATMASLQRSPNIVSALLLTAKGTAFAHYGNPDLDEAQTHPLATGEADQVWSSGINILLAHRVMLQGKSIGVVYISARLTEIHQRARQYLLIAIVILFFCMAAALIVSSVSRRLIAKPIIALADTARRVSRDRDYSIRAAVHADSSEIAVLVNAFNTMLIQIQERDAALTQARDQLENRVEERTADLRAANRELEAFSYTVAHDLRGPLDSIRGIAFLLSQSSDDPHDPHYQQMIEQLNASAINMGSLIDDLLNFARASTMPIQSAPVDLSWLAGKIAAELTSSDPARKVQFQIAETPEVLADAGLMRIVLDNLMRNSWKYTSHRSQACIEFGSRQIAAGNLGADKWVYFVRDDGAGFDPAQMDRLFEPFQRLHGKNEFSGTGIGLATVKRILTRQGGSIWAEGAVEKGATFYFTFG